MGCCASGYRFTGDTVSDGVDLTGQTVVITGATSGIGYETAVTIAKRKARVVLLGRNEKENTATAERVKAVTKNNDVFPMAMDLNSFQSIRTFIAKYKETGWPINIFIANAGVWAQTLRKTTDGLEQIVGVNHFGHHLLITGLVDVLEKSAPARVVMVSSALHEGPAINFENLPVPKSFDSSRQYQQSKLMNALFAKEFGKRYGDKKITAYSLHPGVIRTRLTRDSGCAQCVLGCFGCCLKSAPEGAATTVYCATAKGLESKNGSYFANSQEAPCSKEVKDETQAAKLWEYTEKFIADHSGDKQDEKKA